MERSVRTVLTTGGAGYVGSHAVAALLDAGYRVIVVDNCSNVENCDGSKPACLSALERLSGCPVTFYNADLTNREALDNIFRQHPIDSVIHFAALKAVGESVERPLDYYRNNVCGTIQLLEVMRDHGVHELVFSSSAMVYGTPQYLPLDERHPVGRGCTNPYGKSKYFVEEVLQDLARSEPGRWRFAILRYFNPVGAHPSAVIGENPKGTPNNLVPYVSKVAAGELPELSVYGDDYDTTDGTGVRDYVHVVDLADGHLAALQKLEDGSIDGARVYNLGTGRGHTVLQLVSTFEEVSGRKIPYKIVERRPGDVATLVADVQRAEKELGWKATRGLREMCEDTWRWASRFGSA